MAVTDFIAAIELGSTHITGIAGKKNADGSIQILAYANTPSSDCIKKGQSSIWIKPPKCWFLLSRSWKKICRLPSRKSMWE